MTVVVISWFGLVWLSQVDSLPKGIGDLFPSQEPSLGSRPSQVDSLPKGIGDPTASCGSEPDRLSQVDSLPKGIGDLAVQ